MKLLKHPIRAIREPFGTAGLIIACMALFVALAGGAYAASGGLTGKQKKEVEKIAKKYAGKPGTNGTNGAPGAKGDSGAPGSNGANGTDGSPGGPGSNGKSVEVTQIGTGEPTCNEKGGAVYEVEESGKPTEICNGAAGSPWVVGGLPQGATETGVWTLNASEASAHNGEVSVPIGFAVPLTAPINDEAKVHFVEEGGNGTTCPGSVRVPKAAAGNLCVYQGSLEGALFQTIQELEGAQFEHVSAAGAFLVFEGVEDHAWGRGSWAVTGG